MPADQALGGLNAGVGRSVNVNLSVGGQSRTIATDEEGAAALVDSLRRAGLSAG